MKTPAFFLQFTEEQMRAQYARNVEGFETMLARAIKTGKKVGGYTEAQLRAFIAEYSEKAKTYVHNY
jgi:hypothetical protein